MNWDQHENWLDQLAEMFEAMSGHELDEDDRIHISDLAARVMRGEASLREAARRIVDYLNQHYGLIHFHDRDEFELFADAEGLVDVTDAVKANLEIAGEPGIADGIIRLYASDEIREWDPGWKAKPNQPALGLATKGWFEFANLKPDEHKTFHWAVTTALAERTSTS